MNWYGLNWADIILNTAVLAIVPLLLAAWGGHLAAKAIDDPKRSRNVKLCFWALFLFGVLATFWQQFRAAESDLAKGTSDTWMFIVATRSYAPPAAPECASKVPASSEPLPELAAYLHFGIGKSDILLNVVSVSKTVSMTPQFSPVLWDLDADNPRNPLQIPGQSEPGGYVKLGDFWGPFSLTSSSTENRVKTGHRIFGFVNVSCPLCASTKVYWVFAVIGERGWYAEANKKNGLPSLDGLARNFDIVKADPEAAWNQVITHTKPKVKIADPL